MNQPFSRVFCIPESRVNDSLRFRRRLGRRAGDISESSAIALYIEAETGAQVPWVGAYRDIPGFFQSSELRDVLDSVTHIYNFLLHRAQQFNARSRYVPESYREWLQKAADWKVFVRRVLVEEHTSYVIDESCNVSYAIDEIYSLSRKATLDGLEAEKWAAARAEFERAFACMDGGTPDGNGAVRAIAAAVESCIKTIIPSPVARVGRPELDRHIQPMINSIYGQDGVAMNASNQMLNSLEKWINATHQYRHGQSGDGEISVPLELSIQFLSSGCAYLRWLINVDARRQVANEVGSAFAS